MAQCSRRALLLSALAGAGLMNLAFMGKITETGSVHEVVEAVEVRVRKGALHDFIQTLANETMIHHHTWEPWAIVFLHIPRTGGDSLRTHLFPSDDSWERRMDWRKNVDFLSELHKDGAEEWAHENRKPLYKDFISGAELKYLRENGWKEGWPQVKMFTVLRDPTERVLSAFKYMKEYKLYNCSNPGNLTHFVTERECPGLWRKEALTLGYPPPRERMLSYLNNTMAFQLGDHLQVRKRRASPEEAVEKAKELLKEMDYIAFYEDWNTDMYPLRDAIFADFEAGQNQGSLPARFRRFLFWIGFILSRPRRLVRKYSSQMLDPSDRAWLRDLTLFDQQVYEFARELRGRPLNSLYDNYTQYIMQEGAPALLCALLACWSARSGARWLLARCAFERPAPPVSPAPAPGEMPTVLGLPKEPSSPPV